MTISFKVSDKTKEALIEHFKDLRRDKTPAYAIFQADEEDTVVTLYESGKVVFQGISADVDANFWKETEKILTGSYPEEKEKKKKGKMKPKKPNDTAKIIGKNTVQKPIFASLQSITGYSISACHVLIPVAA